MLRTLRIEKFLLMKNLEVEFGKGLNVISGETGTGKSMTISAIEFVMGKSGDYEDDTAVEMELDMEGEELILRREVKKGRSRYFLNGRGTSLSTIRDMIGKSISIQGQNEFINIMRSDFQRDLLDTAGGLISLREEVERIFDRRKKLGNRLKELSERRDFLNQQRDYLEYRLKEIEEIGVNPEEVEEIRDKAKKLSSLEKIKQHLNSALYHLYGSEYSAHSQLSSAIKEVSQLSEISEEFSGILRDLENLKESLYDAYLNLAERDFDFSQAEVDRINDLVFRIQELERKYGKPYEEIVKESRKLKDQLTNIESLELEIENLRDELSKVDSQLNEACRLLSQKRRETAKNIERKIEKFLSALGLEQAIVRFELSEGEIRRHGTDEVKLLFSSHRGEPREVEKTASGGELSRLFLALSLIMPPARTYIFDEVDAGISGETSLRVARLLRDLSRKMQIIAITHSSALCAAGDENLMTEKIVVGSEAQIKVRKLEEDEKVMEVARLMGATTAKTLESARELIRMVRG